MIIPSALDFYQLQQYKVNMATPEIPKGSKLLREPDSNPVTVQEYRLGQLSKIGGRLEELKRKSPDDKKGQMLLNLGIFAYRQELAGLGFTPQQLDKINTPKPLAPAVSK